MFSVVKTLPWKIGLAVVSLCLIGSILKGCSIQDELVSSQKEVTRLTNVLSAARVATATKLAEAKDEADKAKETMVKAFDEERKDLYDKIHTADALHSDISRRLRYAEDRARILAGQHYKLPSPTKDSKTGEATLRDNGGLILGTFGQEDVDEAKRADVIRLNLLTCYKNYEAVEKSLEQLQK